MEGKKLGAVIISRIISYSHGKYIGYIKKAKDNGFFNDMLNSGILKMCRGEHCRAGLLSVNFNNLSGITKTSENLRNKDVLAKIEKVKEGLSFTFTKDEFNEFFRIDESLFNDFLNKNRERKKEILSLYFRLKHIDTRNKLMNDLLENIKEKQKDFLLSGDENRLKKLGQEEVAKEISTDRGRVSRLSRSFILTPQNKKILLRRLFVSPADIAKNRIKEIVSNKNSILSDGQLKEELKKFGTNVSRRYASYLRSSLGLPAFGERNSRAGGLYKNLSRPFAFNYDNFDSAPRDSGVYVLFSKSRIIYIGSSKNIYGRLKTHFAGNGNKKLKKHIKDGCFFRYLATKHNWRNVEKEFLNGFKKEFGQNPVCNG